MIERLRRLRVPRGIDVRLRLDAGGIVLLAVLAVALVLRLYDLAGWPPELTFDEVDLYNSIHSIATTGRDVDGSLLPFFYCSFTRNPPIYALAEYPTSLLFGDGPFGLRLPAALFGLVAIGWMYDIAFQLSRRRAIAALTAVLVATQPIFVHFSRIAWEPAAELPFLLGGVAFELRALRRLAAPGRIGAPFAAEMFAASVLFGLTAFTYMAGWFYALVLGGGLLLLTVRTWIRRRERFTVLGAVLVAPLVAAPALAMWFGDPHTYARTARISIFHDGVTLAALGTFAQNYLIHFDWSYLVTTGDPIPGSTWRYLVGFGAFYGWLVVLAGLGIGCAGRYLRPGWAAGFAVLWLLAYPLGGALTNEAVPSAPRTLAGAPVFCLLAAIGLVALDDFARFILLGRTRRLVVRTGRIVALVTLAVSTTAFAVPYFRSYADAFPNSWDSGTRSTFHAIRDRAPAYDRVCFALRSAYYASDAYFRYFLGGLALTRIDGIASPDCFLPGTLLVTDLPPVRRPGFTTDAVTLEYEGGTFAALTGRPRDRTVATPVPLPSATASPTPTPTPSPTAAPTTEPTAIRAATATATAVTSAPVPTRT